MRVHKEPGKPGSCYNYCSYSVLRGERRRYRRAMEEVSMTGKLASAVYCLYLKMGSVVVFFFSPISFFASFLTDSILRFPLTPSLSKCRSITRFFLP